MLDLGTLGVRIVADSASAVNTLTSFETTVNHTSNSISGTINNLGKSLNSIGSNLTTKVTLPIAGVSAAVTKIGADFEAQMSSVQAISGATGEELQKLEEKAREIGATTALSSAQAAEGLEYMALAGWKTTEMLEGYDGIVNLALSSNMDLGRASDIVTDNLTAFGLAASDAGHMADVMAYAMSNSNTTTEMLGEAYKNCAATARSFGIGMEETTAWLGKMADNGVKAGEAGTALNAVWARLYGENKAAQKALDEYNLSMYDAQGNAKEFTQVIAEMQEAMSHMSEEEANVFLRNVAGTNQLAAFSTVINTAASDTEEFTNALLSADGTAGEMSEIMQDNLNGSIQILISNLEETAIQLYEMKDGCIKGFVDGLNEMVTSFQNLDDGTKSTIITLAAVAAGIGPVVLIIGSLVKSVGALTSAVGFLFANPVIAGVMALAGAIVYLKVKTLEAKAQQAEYNEKLNEALKMANDYTNATEDETKSIQDEAHALQEQIKYIDSCNGHLEKNNARMQEIQDTMQELDASREEDIVKLQELEVEYQSLTNENMKLISIMRDENSGYYEAVKAINEKYGSMENAKAIEEAYQQRLENIHKAQELVNSCTNESAKELAQQSLQAQTNAAQIEALKQKYISLSNAQKNNASESQELKAVREQLIGIVGNECSYIDQNTGKWMINMAVLNNEIVANDNLSRAKMDACIVMNKNDAKLTETTIENCKTRILALQQEAAALAQLNGMDEAKKGVQADLAYYKELESTLSQLSATTGDYSSAVSDVGTSASNAGETAGSASKEAAKDSLEVWKETYTSQKELGEADAKSRNQMLEDNKKNFKDTTEHIIKYNQFALDESLENIDEISKEEKLSTDEKITLYEKAASNFALSYNDRQKVAEKINEAIKKDLDELTEDMDGMNADQLEDLIDSLEDRKDKYKDYADDVEEINDKLEEAWETLCDKKYDDYKDSIDKMKDKLKEFYDLEKNGYDEAEDAELADVDAKFQAIEDAEEERNNKQKEANYLQKISSAENDDERKKAQEDYDEWKHSLEIKAQKAALKQEKETIKESYKQKREEAEKNYNTTLEILERQRQLAEETNRLMKENKELTEEEALKIAKDKLDEQENETDKKIKEIAQDCANNLPYFESAFNSYGDALYQGLTGRTDDINAYLKRVADSVAAANEGSFRSVDGSHRNGLGYVPFDGYIAELHQGEMVLTKAEAAQYREGNINNNQKTFNITQNISSTSSTAFEQQRAAKNQFKLLAQLY